MYQGYYYNEYHKYQGSYSDGESEESYGQAVHFKDEPEEFLTEEPPWVDHVRDRGDLFYVEPFNEPSTSSESISLDQLKLSEVNKVKRNDKAVLQKLGSVKKIFPSLKREKNDRTTDNKNLKNITSNTVDGVGSDRMSGKNIKKDVSLIVSPPKKSSGKRNDLEGILGIIPGREKSRKISQSGASDTRICIKGFVPDGPALQSGELKIGDTVLSLNRLDLNASNVGTILSAITGPMEITLTIQRFIPSPTPVIPRTIPPRNDSHLIKLISGEMGMTQKPVLKSVPHALLYLTISSSEDDSPDKDIIYQYPQSDMTTSLLCLRGVFLTLGDLLVSVTGSTVDSSTFVLHKKIVQVGYSKLGHHMMVIALPADRISIVQLQKTVCDVTRLLSVIFGSLDRAFCEKCNKVRLDHLFALLFESLLGEDSGSVGPTHKFYDCLPGVRWLDLPTETQMQLNCCLNDLEAADYGELADEYFHIRRAYTILGSSVFYKGHLVANHLLTEDLSDIALYCKYYCLLAMSEEHRVGQLVIWREIFLTRRQRVQRRRAAEYQETKGRWFLLIIGQKHWLYCVVLEAGGASRTAEGYPGPDQYYIEQVKDSLLQIEALDIPSVCEARLRSTPVPPLASSDYLMLSPSAAATVDKSRSSLASPDVSQSRRYNSLESLRLPGDEVDSSDSGSFQSPLRRKGSDSSGSVSSFGTKGKLRSFKSNPSLTSAGTLRKSVSDSVGDVTQLHTSKLTSGMDNTLFQYVSFDSLHGVIVCPTASDNVATGGAVHSEVIKAFHNSCLVIRRMFQPYYKQRLKMKKPHQKPSKFASGSSIQSVVEHGVLFHRIPESGTEQKKIPPVLKYWVIGRLFPGEHPREIYVCHHHGVQQSAVELAFKLCFGTAS